MASRKFLILLLASAFIAASCNQIVLWKPQQQAQPEEAQPIIEIGGKELTVELADTVEKQLLGLSGRESLPQNGGMLFIFSESHRYTFWMKNMNFPLDIIWIKDGRVFEINANAQPEPGVKDSELKIFIPSQAVDRVLEVNAGWTSENNINPGDEVMFRF